MYHLYNYKDMLKTNNSSDNCVLSQRKSKRNTRLVKAMLDLENMVKNNKLGKVLSVNPYEKSIPFNIWFEYDDYKITFIEQNKQFIRARYINRALLTPLVSVSYPETQVKSFLNIMSTYQPFYPESFFSVWELLKVGYLDKMNGIFLSVCHQNNRGSIEALILFNEQNNPKYRDNVYHEWIVDDVSFNKRKNTCTSKTNEPKCLQQAYELVTIDKCSMLAKYNVIFIDCISKMTSIGSWKTEEQDLQRTLCNLSMFIPRMKKDGSLIVKFNMFGRKSWELVMNMIKDNFRTYAFFRPTIANPLNPELYMFARDLIYEYKGPSSIMRFYIDLYFNQTYNIGYIHYSKKDTIKEYSDNVNKWIKNVETCIRKFNADNCELDVNTISDWYIRNDLTQMSELSETKEKFEFVNVPLDCNNSDKIKFKPLVPKILYKNDAYQNLLNKRANLNYYKRVMDTKPSRIFVQNLDKKDWPHQQNFITWENVTYALDIYCDVKKLIKDSFGGEMVTNAWLKMYEIISTHKNLVPKNKKIKTFSLCEAPGAFVSAINHYTFYLGIEHEWYAQTLNMNETNAIQDYYGFIKSHPDRWLFGPKDNNTGDITSSDIIKSYSSDPRLEDIDFITADAGIHCEPTKLNEQESILAKINMGQIVCILACLPVGKSAVFKTFLPMSEPLTISMMWLVTTLFENVNITKPNTSNSSNSEVYVVLEKYNGISKQNLTMLYQMLDDPNITSETLFIPKNHMSFVKKYTEKIIPLIDRQIVYLKNNFFYYYNTNKLGNIDKLRVQLSNEWIRAFPTTILERHLLEK